MNEKTWHYMILFVCHSTVEAQLQVRPMVPNLGESHPPGGFGHLGGGGQLSKTIQKHLFGLKNIHLIYNSKAPDSLNFYEIKFN